MKWNWNWNSNWFVINMIQFMRSAIGRSTVAGKISITIQNYETVSFSRRKKDLVAVFSHVKIDRFVSDGLDQFGIWLISTSRYSSGCLYLENVTADLTNLQIESCNLIRLRGTKPFSKMYRCIIDFGKPKICQWRMSWMHKFYVSLLFRCWFCVVKFMKRDQLVCFSCSMRRCRSHPHITKSVQSLFFTNLLFVSWLFWFFITEKLY